MSTHSAECCTRHTPKGEIRIRTLIEKTSYCFVRSNRWRAVKLANKDRFTTPSPRGDDAPKTIWRYAIASRELLRQIQTRIDLLFTMSDIPQRPAQSGSARKSYSGRIPNTARWQQRHKHGVGLVKPSGGARRDRTDDLMLAKHALSQLSYGPVTRRRKQRF